MDDAVAQLLEAWWTNHRINLFLIEKISDEGMRSTLSTRGGRNVVRQLCHVHNNRVWQLESRARDLAEGLYKFETQEEPDRATLARHMTASAERVATFLEDCARGVPKRRAFKKGAITHLGYLIAHESHHRGNILLTLKQRGHGLDKASAYAIWNWDKM